MTAEMIWKPKTIGKGAWKIYNSSRKVAWKTGTSLDIEMLGQ